MAGSYQRRIVLFGANGQVGQALATALSRTGWDVSGYAHQDLDIRDAMAVRDAVSGAAAVINAAAFTDVERAETDREACLSINAHAPGRIAALCDAAGAAMVQFSSDYVFSGHGRTPWREDDACAPLSHYGACKAEGERLVRDNCARHLILRTSWVFSGTGRNFVATMLGLAESRTEIAVVDDQIGGPTPADAIAEAVVVMLAAALDKAFAGWGTYHLSGKPTVSWRSFAQAILTERHDVHVRAIASAEHPARAVRPLNSVLDCGKIKRVFGIAQPDWRPALSGILDRR